MNQYKSILRSNRFHALVALSIFVILGARGILPLEIVSAAVTILAGHIGIRTIDRLGEKIGNGNTH